jgi:hypothetical protein
MDSWPFAKSRIDADVAGGKRVSVAIHVINVQRSTLNVQWKKSSGLLELLLLFWHPHDVEAS